MPGSSDVSAETVKIPVMAVQPLNPAATNKPTGKVENTYYPEIEFLTTEEFEQIPKCVIFIFISLFPFFCFLFLA